MKNVFILTSCLLTMVVFSQAKPIVLPFKNLPYPIDSVTNCMTYTQRSAESFGRIFMILDDVTFYSNASRNVRTVVGGKIVAATQVFDKKWLVIVRQGDYLFVYAGLSDVSIKQGDDICLNSVIGRTGLNDDGDKYSVSLYLHTKEKEWDPEPVFSYQDTPQQPETFVRK